MLSKEELQLQAKDHKKDMVNTEYRHFKGGLYIVDNIAVHSEDEGLMVIYHSKDNPDKVWARPLEMFVSKVDKEKYPEIKQEYRFEKVN